MTWYSCCCVVCCLVAVSCDFPKPTSTKTVDPKSVGLGLTVDEVLNWRNSHGGDLLGKDKDAVIARYGEPSQTPSESHIDYKANGKSLDRDTSFLIEGSKISVIKVYQKQGDSLNVEEVIKRGTMFTFDTGTFTDTTANYFSATTNDGRNMIQFLTKDSGVSLRAVMFMYKP